jgi:hypothetical protein
LRTESKRGLAILDEPSVTQRYPAMLPEAPFSLGVHGVSPVTSIVH